MENIDLIALIQTQLSHIDTLDRILKHIQQTLVLSNIAYDHKDYEEMKAINSELIEFIQLLLKEELN